MTGVQTCALPIYALPGWQLSRAFTSARVCSLLSKRGKEVPDAAGAIAQARAEGAEHIALATLLISPGEEYEGVLAEDEDLDALAAYYAGVQHDCGTPLLLMGHGHPSNGNPAYRRLRQRLPEQVYLACLSGADNLTALLPELLSQPARRITLEPLLDVYKRQDMHNRCGGFLNLLMLDLSN